ncbi:TetR/AcrR family transcriptional regulator [Kribbella sp. CA-293567]|uniref:TetR/AcrR family transcriptional regulator n=1 Tax=Kribbella sp. CA-293567 TaxID=3002436 RepID=UPI0022DE508F|nr:TetR/AcrR family transcriptional regulator [Kribbella sp. CA-293567]WBQ04513.1 TetR/AcrR family transcriptional regulator [Kribbella sp. CA-293567]
MSTGRARERNKRGEGAQLREEIVSAATRLLDAGTEQSVTLRAVAREAGITAPSIYSHFADRDAILLAVTQNGFAELELVLREASVGASAGADPVERLRAVCTAYLEFAQCRPARYRILFGAAWDASQTVKRAPKLAPDLAVLGMDAFGILQQSVADCVAAGRSASTDPMADATALWVGLHGLAQLRVAASLFPWPAGLQDTLVERLTLLR